MRRISLALVFMVLIGCQDSTLTAPKQSEPPQQPAPTVELQALHDTFAYEVGVGGCSASLGTPDTTTRYTPVPPEDTTLAIAITADTARIDAPAYDLTLSEGDTVVVKSREGRVRLDEWCGFFLPPTPPSL